jgi:hypothetical protein
MNELNENNPSNEPAKDVEAILMTPDQIAAQHAFEQILAQEDNRRFALEEEMKKYKVSLRIIGHKEALELRDHNKFNRTKSRAHVRKLAQFQRDSNWLFNGMSVVFSGNGNGNGSQTNEHGDHVLFYREVLDGGHRIESIVQSGIPQLFVCVEGVSRDAFETYDIYNKKRSSSDHLTVLGEEHPTILSDALGWLTARTETGKDAVKTSAERWTTKNLLYLNRKHTLKEHPGIRSFVAKYATQKGGLRLPKGLLATAEYLMAVQDAEQAAIFMSYVMTGAELSETDQAFVFRAWFESLPLKKRTKKDLARVADGLTVAWNAVRKGETIGAIKIPNAPLAFK